MGSHTGSSFAPGSPPLDHHLVPAVALFSLFPFSSSVRVSKYFYFSNIFNLTFLHCVLSNISSFRPPPGSRCCSIFTFPLFSTRVLLLYSDLPNISSDFSQTKMTLVSLEGQPTVLPTFEYFLLFSHSHSFSPQSTSNTSLISKQTACYLIFDWINVYVSNMKLNCTG